MYVIVAKKAFESIDFKSKLWNIAFLGILIFTTTELTVNDANIMKLIKNNMSKIKFENYSFCINYLEKEYEKLEKYDSSLYRIEDRIRFNANDGIAIGANTMNFCGSTYSRSLHDFLQSLGYSNQHVTTVSDFGNTISSDMLFGIKYILNARENDKFKEYESYGLDDGTEMLKNPYDLGLGFRAKNLDVEEIDFRNPFKNFNNIITTFSGIDEDIYTKHKEKLTQTLENLAIEENIIFRRQTNAKDSYIKYEFQAERTENLYLYIHRGKFRANKSIYKWKLIRL